MGLRPATHRADVFYGSYDSIGGKLPEQGEPHESVLWLGRAASLTPSVNMYLSVLFTSVSYIVLYMCVSILIFRNCGKPRVRTDWPRISLWGLALLAEIPLTGADWLFRFQNGTSWLENSNSTHKLNRRYQSLNYCIS